MTLILLFFFLTIPPPPRSTLFPYTTLFRSHPGSTGGISALVNKNLCTEGACDGPHSDPPVSRDRKSTRLNSSHSQISYAVFCLKKKKKKKHQTLPKYKNTDIKKNLM